ncbi:MAG: S41 family peptidase [Candidatus Zixiibacteriota bacterium]
MATRESGKADDAIKIDNKIKAEIIDSVTARVNEIYIFPDVAKKLEKQLKDNLKKGEYDKFNELQPFVEQLKTEFYEIGNDRHLRIFTLSDEFCSRFKSNQEAKDYYEKNLGSELADNHGFRRVEILDGNIGYLDLRDFLISKDDYNVTAAAMTLLAGCDAIIIDLRKNGGGDGNVVAFLASYFFKERTRLNDAYIRKTDSVEQYWSFPVPNAEPFYDKDLYVITGYATFSAAEDFAYAMQASKRATIIGEKTRGGGHPIEMFFFLDLHVSLDIPNAYSVNSITGTGWEGVGIIPDFQVPFEESFDFAYLKALENQKSKTEDAKKRNKIDWAIAGINAHKNPVVLDEAVLQKYAGNYGERAIIYKENHIFYQRNDKSTFMLYPMTETLFEFRDWGDARIEFVKDSSGQVIEFNTLSPDGSKSACKRTSD